MIISLLWNSLYRLKDLQLLNQRVSRQTSQRKSVMPPRGLATNYKWRRGNNLCVKRTDRRRLVEGGSWGTRKQLKWSQALQAPAVLEEQPVCTKQSWQESSKAGIPHLLESPFPYCTPGTSECDFLMHPSLLCPTKWQPVRGLVLMTC